MFNTRIRIATPLGPKNDRDRTSQVTLYRAGTIPKGLPGAFMYDDAIEVQVCHYTRTANVIVHVNVYKVATDSQYRAALRSLLGNQFGRFVSRRIRSHRRWNTEAERPYVTETRFEGIIAHIVEQVQRQQQREQEALQSRHAMQQTQIAAT